MVSRGTLKLRIVGSLPRPALSVFRALLPRRVLARLRPDPQANARRYAGAATADELFTGIYRDNAWLSGESVSGPGSELRRTVAIRAALPALLREMGVAAVLDAPCGDFNWMREVDLGGARYTGVDLVADLISRNAGRYGAADREFLAGDITRMDLPAADLILCRDCWIHLPNRMVLQCVANFRRSGARLLLATHYSSWPANGDITLGGFRPINLCRPPFNFPPPLREVHEGKGKGRGKGEGESDHGRCLALWPLADVPAPPPVS